MEAYDPTTWTGEYVRANKEDCTARLAAGVRNSIAAIHENDYYKALVGLSATFHGLETMNSSGCGDFGLHLVVLSWCLGNIVAIKGIDLGGNELSNEDRIEGAKILYEASLECIDDTTVKQDIEKKLRLLRSTDKYSFKQQVEPEFPQKTLVELNFLKEQLESACRSSASSSSSGKSGGCYVATCVYGSYDCPQVWTLRRFRDYTLAATWHGRAFIRTYYAVSPTLVKWFGQTHWFRKMWQGRLDRMVANLQKKGVASTPYEDKMW